MKQNKKKLIIIMLCFIVVVTILIIALLNLFSPKETHTTSNDASEVISYLYCSANKPENAFFHDETAKREINEIKISAKDEKIDKLQLTYTGDFEDGATAKLASDELQANYNLYMQTTSVYLGDLSPNFSVANNQVIINLIFGEKTLTSETAKILMLSESDARNYQKYSLSTMKKTYDAKGFSCKITN